MSKASEFRSLAMLYVGRVVGAAANFAFLPVYSQALGPETFGIVAVVLSMQAMALMLDIGVSSYVAREIADPEAGLSSLPGLVKAAGLALVLVYLLVGAGVVLTKLLGGLPGLGVLEAIGVVVLLWLAVLQNLYFVSAMAAGSYAEASAVQAGGVIVRGVGTTVVLLWASPTLAAFIACQVGASVLHALAARLVCYRGIGAMLAFAWSPGTLRDALAIMKRGWALGVSSAAGGAVMQLDKPIVSLLISASAVSPYFLATTLCLTPLSMLVGPVSQYFQPKIVRQVASSTETARHTLDRFMWALFGLGVLPTLVLWTFRERIVAMWLGPDPSAAQVSGYVYLLLPGIVFGVFAYVAQALLMSLRDFRFLAVQSGVVSVATLVCLVIAAAMGSMTAVCIVYAGYYICATVLLWLRASALPAVSTVARRAASQGLLMLVAAFAAGLALNALLSRQI